MEQVPKTEVTEQGTDAIWKRCRAEIYNPETIPWEDIKNNVVAIEKEHFGAHAFSEEELMEGFTGASHIAVLLEDQERDGVIGFTYAIPVAEEYGEDFHPERIAHPGTAYIENTAIDRNYIGHHLVEVLMETLEAKLRRRGYTHMERDAAVANEYAENIRKAYGDRVLVSSEPHDSEFGQQVFFRIKL